jgi:ABC-2 type transport system ATP-binding protein
LLSEIGENTIVILSTHIVEDVTNLCSDMAIINKGEVVATGNPNDLVDSMNGKIWQKMIEKSEVAAYEAQYHVIAKQLKMGKTEINVLADSLPAEGFKAAEANLEHVYFAKIAA